MSHPIFKQVVTVSHLLHPLPLLPGGGELREAFSLEQGNCEEN